MAVDPVTSVLVRNLDRELRAHVLARRDAMLREMRLMTEREDASLSRLRVAGWNDERLEVLCGLNSFYQLVLGPLASSARERFGILGRETTILYGETLRFDADRSLRLRSAHRAFMEALAEIPDAIGIVTAPHFSDLAFRLTRSTPGDSRV